MADLKLSACIEMIFSNVPEFVDRIDRAAETRPEEVGMTAAGVARIWSSVEKLYRSVIDAAKGGAERARLAHGLAYRMLAQVDDPGAAVPLHEVAFELASDDERTFEFLLLLYKARGEKQRVRDIAARAAKVECDKGKSAYLSGQSVYLDFAEAIGRLGRDVVADRYGNLFDMYKEILGDDPYRTPMMIYPAPHYTMGGLWVDYNLMSNVPGLFVLGEANFSDHGANRLGASALMQGLADGYFVIPYTLGGYLAGTKLGKVTTDHDAFREAEASVTERTRKLLSTGGKRTPQDLHRQLGKVMWEHVGMGRNAKGLKEAIAQIPAIREEFWKTVSVTGSSESFNQTLERAGRVADFLEFGELLAKDALVREESCGGHFREEHQTEDGEAKRDDANFSHVAAWEYNGEGKEPTRHTEPLTFENVHIAQRNYA